MVSPEDLAHWLYLGRGKAVQTLTTEYNSAYNQALFYALKAYHGYDYTIENRTCYYGRILSSLPTSTVTDLILQLEAWLFSPEGQAGRYWQVFDVLIWRAETDSNLRQRLLDRLDDILKTELCEWKDDVMRDINLFFGIILDVLGWKGIPWILARIDAYTHQGPLDRWHDFLFHELDWRFDLERLRRLAKAQPDFARRFKLQLEDSPDRVRGPVKSRPPDLEEVIEEWEAVQPNQSITDPGWVSPGMINSLGWQANTEVAAQFAKVLMNEPETYKVAFGLHFFSRRHDSLFTDVDLATLLERHGPSILTPWSQVVRHVESSRLRRVAEPLLHDWETVEALAVLSKNFKSGDQEIIQKHHAYASTSEYDWEPDQPLGHNNLHMLAQIVADWTGQGNPEQNAIRKEAMHWSSCGYEREYITKRLIEEDALTEHELEELTLDANEETRKQAYEALGQRRRLGSP